ncbi:MAG: hypothetical protein ACRDH6_06730 [Actinomycetota bacterium]
MGLLDRLRKGKDGGEGEAGAPSFVNKEQKGGNTYEVYKGGDAESAKAFLLTKNVSQPLYYVVVETGDGVWGADKEGLYLENLRPWQTDVGSAEVEVASANVNSMSGLAMAARGITDNFISLVSCGSCGREWHDGVRYQNVTVVRCPDCGKTNSVDTSNIKAYF